MSFMQWGWLLAFLPFIALPIVIHLMNQRRFQTMEWGAMIFLLAANKMARGFAKLRRWLILAARALVIAGLVFALGRPLASGWLGLAAGNSTDTTIVLMDRSPSMSAMDSGNVSSKLASGRKQLADALDKLNSKHWVMIDSATSEPSELGSSADLLSAANAEPAGASADLPTMMQSALEYVKANQTGRTDIWICSDLRQHDWDAEGGRWSAIRDRFLELPQACRFYLLAFPDVPKSNRSIRVKAVRRVESESGAELLVSLEIKRNGGQTESESFPIEFNIDGARSSLNAELTGATFELTDHRIPLGSQQVRGWGRVSIPADSVEPDNEFFFVFDEQPTRRTLIVTDVPDDVRALQIAAEIPAEASAETSVEVIAPRQLDTVAWDEIGLVLWQAQLPKPADAMALQSFVSGEGRVVFMPPRSPNDQEVFGLKWAAWQPVADDVTITTWRGDAGLLSNTRNGMALPIGELRISNVCRLEGDHVPLASLSDGTPILARAPTDHGGVYVLATTAMPENSTLEENGIVLYVAIQRALSAGSARLADVRQVVAGEGEYNSAPWQRVTGANEALSNQLQFHSGVFQEGERLMAFNRAEPEDSELVVSDEKVATLFEGLPFVSVKVEDRAGASSSLISEIWRIFLTLMLIAMVAEAILCMPRKNPETAGTAMKGAIA